MPVVALDHLAPGAVLTSPVHDRRGRLLLPPGQEITHRNLTLLRTWGIARVEVARSDPGFGDAEDRVGPAGFDPARGGARPGLRTPGSPGPADDPVRRAAARVAAEARLGLQDLAHPLVMALLDHVEGRALVWTEEADR